MDEQKENAVTKSIRGKDRKALHDGDDLAPKRESASSGQKRNADRPLLGNSRRHKTARIKTRPEGESEDGSQSTILNPQLWAYVEYGKRSLLPAIAGVYCVLTSGDAALYVGESENIYQRWRGHHLKHLLRAGASLRIAWRETFSEAGRLKMEALLVRKHQPRLNVNLLPRPAKVMSAPLSRSAAVDSSLAVMTVREVAEKLDANPGTVRMWCINKTFSNAVQEETLRGPVWLIPESDLKDFEKRGRGRPPNSSKKAAKKRSAKR